MENCDWKMKNEHKKTPKPCFGVFLFALFAEQHTVALDIELLEQVADGKVLLLLTADINDNATGIHHNQTVAVLDGVLNVVRLSRATISSVICSTLSAVFGSSAAVCSSSSSRSGLRRVAISRVSA